ncbi:hypothetical protein COL65_06070 [Priestia aryabhattai]|uniref:hypothetical protein n=1 Tax=Priestia aryabhattai TaxID=412384 RepID=UPI000BF26BA1|nr:hypothetical protein [Priestia aryabhattai]PGA20506.1 hypothetical protein COL65_06070 [Priestia aryabhattai]
MRKRKQKALISGITLSTVGVGITSYLLSDAAKRRKVKGLVRSAKVKLSSLSKKQQVNASLNKDTHSDPTYVSESNMISEGPMYQNQHR